MLQGPCVAVTSEPRPKPGSEQCRVDRNYFAVPTMLGEPSSTKDTSGPASSGDEDLNPLTMR